MMIALAPRIRGGVVNVNDLRDVQLDCGSCPAGCVPFNTPQDASDDPPSTAEELIELILEIVAIEPELEDNATEAIAALLEE